MNKYFKKFSVMFVVLLAVIGIGAIQNGSIANASTVGQQLTSPESGWQRYDDTNSNITYSSKINVGTGYTIFENGNDHYTYFSGTIKFSFYGSKIRLYDNIYTNRNRKSRISFDGGLTYESCSAYGANTTDEECYFEKTGLPMTVHNVVIDIQQDDDKLFVFDCFDVDGYVLGDESITLDKSTMDLNVGDTKQLTATTTPAAAQVNLTWTSSDSSIATVDENGNVTAKGEGTCTITATINDGSGISASCEVDVTKNDTEPSNPADPTGDASLYIELVDGQIKQYSVSSDEINKFTEWYENRDKDHSLKATYKFTKGTYTDYVVHDQIDWFEVR